MKNIVVLVMFLWAILAECSSYVPRGWRPQGQSFNPSSNHLSTYGPPSAPLIYGAHNLPTRQPAVVTTPPTTTAATTTPKSREPTTASDVSEEDDFESNPALAIANSYAFNKPVYILNTFPFQTAGYTFF